MANFIAHGNCANLGSLFMPKRRYLGQNSKIGRTKTVFVPIQSSDMNNTAVSQNINSIFGNNIKNKEFFVWETYIVFHGVHRTHLRKT